MTRQYALRVMDTHAGGDVSRIVLGGVKALPGANVREQMVYLRDHADGLRRLLLEEPNGIPEMSVDLIVPASQPEAVAGYVIMEVMGYPIYSGSNTLCTATAVLEAGLVDKREGEQRFVLEAPAGRVEVSAVVEDDVVRSVTCEGLPSYIDTVDACVDVPGVGRVMYHVAYSGGFYALVDAQALGFSLVAAEERQLAETAHAIVEAIRRTHAFVHDTLGDVGPLPFLHFMGPVETLAPGYHRARSATYVHPGVICRSTTGTGTSARLALMNHQGLIEPGDRLETESLRHTRFIGEFVARETMGTRQVVKNTITGRAYVIAETTLIANADDPMIEPLCLDHVIEPRRR